jgi:hypothetical protein
MSDAKDGYRLYSYREGDRYEYLATYALTRIAFVTPVRRTEDFGVIDLHCVLTRTEGNSVIPSCPFNVQVKSDVSEVVYQAKKIAWISANMDCPLFICSVSRDEDPRIRMFSCMNIWSAVFFRGSPTSVTLHLKPRETSEDPWDHHAGTSGNGQEDMEGTFDVFLGAPVVDKTLSDFASDRGAIFAIMEPWIKLDWLNSAFMRLGRAAAITCQNNIANQPPSTPRLKSFTRSPNQHGLVDKILPLLGSLGDSFDRFNDTDRAEMIRELIGSLKQYPEEQKETDPRGFLDRLVSF